MSLQLAVLKLNSTRQSTLVIIQCLLAILQLIIECKIVQTSTKLVWRYDSDSSFLDQMLLQSHNEKEFWRRCKVKRSTFYYICSLLAPALSKSKQGGGIPLENRVALSLNRLGSGNYLLSTTDLFGMSEGLACIVVREFCDAVMTFIRPLVIPPYSRENLRKIAIKFEEKHGLPYIMGTIDGSHIPIIAPQEDPTFFYNRKGFHSTLLQGIVDTECIFWDWDFGWAGSLHDYSVFVESAEGRNIMAGRYRPYKLIVDAAYPFRPYMWVPFKGGKENLPPARAHWNFVQSSTRMCVERAFRILKGRWRILLQRIEMDLQNVAKVVGACICLHNLCILHKDFVDASLVEEARKWLHKQHSEDFGDLRNVGTMRILDYGNFEVSRANMDVSEVIQKSRLVYDAQEGEVGQTDPDDGEGLIASVNMHRSMVDILFNRHLRQIVQFPEGILEEESDESSFAGDEWE